MRYIIILLILLASCHSARIEETKNIEIDSTFWKTSLMQLTHADIQDKVKVSVVVEKMLPDSTGALHVTEKTAYSLNQEHNIVYTEERKDTVEHKETSAKESNEEIKEMSPDKPPDDELIIIVLFVIILFIWKK